MNLSLAARRGHAGSRPWCRGMPAVLRSASVLLLMALGACGPRTTQLRIIDHRDAGADALYYEHFDECYYDTDAEGNINLVLRRERPMTDDPSQVVRQVVVVRSFWKPIPGVTVAHDEQINATVNYMILSGRVGASFEGAGSVFFRGNRADSVLEGELGLAYLSPRTRLNDGRMLFDRAEVSGTFRARRDPRRVVRILNEMDDLFGLDGAEGAQASAVQR